VLAQQQAESVIEMGDGIGGRVPLGKEIGSLIAENVHIDSLELTPNDHPLLLGRPGDIDSKQDGDVVRDEAVVSVYAGNKVVLESGNHPVENMSAGVCEGGDMLLEAVVAEKIGCTLGVGLAGLVPVDVKVAQNDGFNVLGVVVVEGLSEFFKEGGLFELIL
jgi:hypothetical protein